MLGPEAEGRLSYRAVHERMPSRRQLPHHQYGFSTESIGLPFALPMYYGFGTYATIAEDAGYDGFSLSINSATRIQIGLGLVGRKGAERTIAAQVKPEPTTKHKHLRVDAIVRRVRFGDDRELIEAVARKKNERLPVTIYESTRESVRTNPYFIPRIKATTEAFRALHASTVQEFVAATRDRQVGITLDVADLQVIDRYVWGIWNVKPEWKRPIRTLLPYTQQLDITLDSARYPKQPPELVAADLATLISGEKQEGSDMLQKLRFINDQGFHGLVVVRYAPADLHPALDLLNMKHKRFFVDENEHVGTLGGIRETLFDAFGE